MLNVSALSRRTFLAGSLAAACSPFVRLRADDAAARTAFFLVSDTHYLANKAAPGEIDAASAQVCGKLVEVLNRLPGTALPEAIGGGTVLKPAGVIHGGDIIDTGDKNGRVQEEMQRTEFSAYEKDYGLNGGDGKLKYPVYEVHGNHDSPRSTGHAIDRLKERNKSRKGLSGLSDSALQFSWDMGPLHCINLGLTVGPGDGANARRRYNPAASLEFLQADLKRNAANGNRPVVITHHVDTQRYRAFKGEVKGVEWDPEDVKLFGEALAPYSNIAMVFYGHTHFRADWKWEVSAGDAKQSIDVFNCDNSSHFHGGKQAFLYCESSASELLIRECFTNDGWETIAWTPQVWRKALSPAK